MAETTNEVQWVAPFPPIRLLILEDAPEDAELELRALQAAGLEVDARVVASREAFEHQVDEFQPQLILSDFTVPGFSGDEALVIVKDRCPSVPIIFMSGTIGEERAVDLLNDGAWDYVLKDRPKRLAPAVKRALERAETAAQLAAHKRFYETLVRNSRDVIEVVDRDAHVVMANPAFEQLLGYSPDELKGLDLLALVHPDDRAHVADAMARAVADPGSNSPFTYRVRTKGGGWRVVEAVSANCLDDPIIRGILVNTRDVTDLQEARERDRLHARMLDWVGAAVIATDLDLRITYWNKAAERLYGWTAEEAIGRSATDLFMPWLDAEEGEWIRQELRTKPQEHERELARKDGKRVFVISRTVPQYEGDQVIGVVGVSVDISERKAAERELTAAGDFLSAVTDSMSEGLFALDESGRVTYSNAAASWLLGWTAEELWGRGMHELAHYKREDGTPYPIEECPILHVNTSGETANVDRDVFVRRDGSHLPVAYTASGLRADGVRGCVVVFRDITEQLSEELRVKQELDKLAWVGRIQDALDQDRFALYAQPIQDLRTGNVVRHELLIRMLSPGGAVIEPGRFLPTAEDYGLIGRIDRWVVEQAARLAAAGHAVEFNLSARSVGDEGILASLREALAVSGASPGLLVCEITETALMRDVAAGERFAKALERLGCQLALDDFGVGFGGFTYLKNLPVRYLKIDIQFVRDAVKDEASQHVIRAVVSLARAFGVGTVAEGAEDPETVELLKTLKVDFVQGYTIGRPAPIAETLRPGL